MKRHKPSSTRPGSLLAALLLLAVAHGGAAAGVFGQDDIIVARVITTGNYCGGYGVGSLVAAADCLTSFQLLAFRYGDTSRPVAYNPPLFGDVGQQPCTTIGGPDVLGLQLSLSGDGRMVTFPCYSYAPGILWADRPDRAVGILRHDGMVTTSRCFNMPGLAILAAATDDGRDAFIAAGKAGLFYLPDMGLPDDDRMEPVLVYSGKPVLSLSIVNRTHLWLTTGDSILSFTLTQARLANAGGAMPKLVMAAPRRADGRQSVLVGHAMAMYPRAGKLYEADPYDVVWSDSEDGPLPSSYAFVSHANDGTGTNVYPIFGNTTSSVTQWDIAANGGLSDITLQSQGETFHLTAQLSRYRNTTVIVVPIDQNAGTAEQSGLGIATLLATSTHALYNYSYIAIEHAFSEGAPTIIYSIPATDRVSYRLAGVSFAPFDVREAKETNPFPYRASPVPTPSIAPTPTGTNNRYAGSPSKSPDAFVNRHDFGLYVGPDLSGAGNTNGFTRYALILRVGGERDPYSILSTTPDYRTLAEPRIAQPLFIDKFDRTQNRVVATLALPATRNGPHAACTGSFADYKMFPTLRAGESLRFVTVHCFDAEAGKEIIPNSYYASDDWNPPAFAPNAKWSHPRRVIANVHVGGWVDTRTVLSDLCSTAVPVAAIRGGENERYKHEYYYVATRTFADAPRGETCGVRFVTHGCNGTSACDEPLLRPSVSVVDASQAFFSAKAPFVFNDNPEALQFSWVNGQQFLSNDLDDGAMPIPGADSLAFAIALAKIPFAPRPFYGKDTAIVTAIDTYIRTMAIANPADSYDRKSLILLFVDALYGRLSNYTAITSKDGRMVVSIASEPGSQQAASTFNPRSSILPSIVLTNKNMFVVTASLPGGFPDLVGSRAISLQSLYRASVKAALNGSYSSEGLLRADPYPPRDPHAPLGSAFLEYKPLPLPGTMNVVASLPCCAGVWVSVLANIFSHTEQLTSVTPTATVSATHTPYPSPSAPPFAFVMKPAPVSFAGSSSTVTSYCDVGSSESAPCLSRALPPAPLFASVRGCPSGKATLQCDSSHPALAGIRREGPADVDCPSSGTAFARLAPQLKVVPQPLSRLSSALTLPKTVSVACNLTSSRDSTGERLVAHSEVTFAYQPFQFPQWRELLLFFPKEGVVLSPTHGVSLSMTENSAQLQGSMENSTVFAPAWAEYCSRSFANASTGCLPEYVVRSLVSRLPSPVDLVKDAVGAAGPSRARRAFTATVSRAAYGILVSAAASSPVVPLSPETAAQSGLFTLFTRISIGGYPATVLWVSADGTLLHFRFPQQLCASNASVASATDSPSGCGYQPLTITQPLPFVAGHPSASAVNMSCPPLCPGFFRDGSSGQRRSEAVESSPTQPFVDSVYPLLVASAATFPTANDVEGVSGQKAPYPSVSDSSTSTGLYFTFACPGFVDPSLGSSICANASHPLSSSCAFGDGASVACRTCPANSLCPGGARAQPFPRFWAASETSGAIIPCAPPSEARCLGWSASLSAVQCGADYDQSSYACLGCAKGRYPSETDSSCLLCDTSAPVLQILRRFFVIVGAILGIATLLFGCLWLLAKSLGSTLSGSASRFVDLLLFMVLLLQMLSEVAATATSGLPLSLKALYDFLASFNLKNVPIHQRCLEGIPPFLGDILGYSFVLCANAVLLFSTRREWRTAIVSSAVTSSSAVKMVTSAPSGAGSEKDGSTGGRRRSTLFYQSQSFGKVRRWLDVARARVASSLTSDTLMKALCIALVALYSRTCNAVFASLDCFEGQLTLQQVEGLDGRSTELVTSTAADSTSGGLTSPTPSFVTVNLLRSNPSFVCYSGSHQAAGVLAWFVLVTYLIGFPVWTLWLGARRRQASSLPSAPASGPASGSHGPVVAFFLHNTIRESAFFFRQIEMALLFILSLIAVFWRQASSEAGYAGRGSITCLLLLSLLGVMLWLKPYTTEEKWRLPVRACSFLLACLVAIINALQGSATLAQSPSSSLEQRVQDLGIVLIVAMVLYLLVLVYFVGSSMIQGARVEASLLAVKRKAHAAVAIAAGGVALARADKGIRAPKSATVVTSPLHQAMSLAPASATQLVAAGKADRAAFADISPLQAIAGKTIETTSNNSGGGRIFVSPPSQVRAKAGEKSLAGDFVYSASDANATISSDAAIAHGDGRIFVSPAMSNHPAHYGHLRLGAGDERNISNLDGWSEFGADSTVFRVANPIGQQQAANT